MASSTSTHPSFTSSFESIFQDYGPAYRYPVFDKTSGYRWKVAARLDNSFSFLLPKERLAFPTTENPPLFFAWLAEVIDSEGSIDIIHVGHLVRIKLEISNQEVHFLLHIKNGLMQLGYFPTGPYRRQSKGYVTNSWNIKYNNDMYYLAIQRVHEIKEILNRTPLLHAEKQRRKEYVLNLRTPIRWEVEEQGITALRDETKRSVQAYVQQARESYQNRRAGKATLTPSPVLRQLPTS